jgi:hypothetical protein
VQRYAAHVDCTTPMHMSDGGQGRSKSAAGEKGSVELCLSLLQTKVTVANHLLKLRKGLRVTLALCCHNGQR